MLFTEKERDIADALVRLSERGHRQVNIFSLLDTLVEKTAINGNDFYQFIQQLNADKYIRLDYDNNFPKMITPQLMDKFKRRYPRITITSDSVCEDLLNLCDNHSIYVYQKLIDASERGFGEKDEKEANDAKKHNEKVEESLKEIVAGTAKSSDSLTAIHDIVDGILSEASTQTIIQEEIRKQVSGVLSENSTQTKIQEETRQQVGNILSEASTQTAFIQSIDNKYNPNRIRTRSWISIGVAFASLVLALFNTAKSCSSEENNTRQKIVQQEATPDSLSLPSKADLQLEISTD